MIVPRAALLVPLAALAASAPVRILEGTGTGDPSPWRSTTKVHFGEETLALWHREPSTTGVSIQSPDIGPLRGAVRMELVLATGSAHAVSVVPLGAPDDVTGQYAAGGPVHAPVSRGPQGPPSILSLPIRDAIGIVHPPGLPGAAALHGLRIGIDGDPDARVLEIALSLDRVPSSGVDSVNVGGVYRPARWLVGTASAVYELIVPSSGAELIWFDAGLGAGGVRTITLTESGRKAELFRAAGASPWTRRAVSLEPFAGRRVAVELSQSAGNDAIALFGDLQVVPGAEDTGTEDVVVYLIDALRADALGAYGDPSAASPFLDRLARAGRQFTLATSTSSWTKPAIPTLMSGIHPEVHGIGEGGISEELPARVPLLAEVLGRGGRRTGSFVGSELGSVLTGLERGFDVAVVPTRWKGAPTAMEAPTSDQIVDEALAWMDEDPDRPLFAYLHLMEVHRHVTAMFSRLGRPPEEAYRQSVVAADVAFGRFRAGLRRRGRLPVLVLLSDHGESLGEHGVAGHGKSLYQEEIHIPLLVGGRGIAPGIVDAPVSLADVAPSITDALEAPGLAPTGTALALRGNVPLPSARAVVATLRTAPRGEATDHRYALLLPDRRKLLRARSGDVLRILDGEAATGGDATELLREWIAETGRARERFLEVQGVPPASSPTTDQEERLRSLGYLD